MSKELTISCKKDILLKMNNLNKLEQKLLFLILSKINPLKDNANQTKLIKLSKQHIKEVLNLTYEGFYKNITEVTLGLNTKFIFEAKKDKKEEGYFHGTWVATAESKLYDTNIEFEITPKMITYFTDLTPPYANIELKYILKLNSKYSIGLYNLVKADLYKQVKYGHNINYGVDFLNKIFDLNYKYKDLKRFVINVAIDEINKNTDITINFIEIKNGRKVEEITFVVYNKSNEELKTLDSVRQGIISNKEKNTQDNKSIEINSSTYRAELNDGHHLIFDKLVSNGINEKKAYELIQSKDISNDIISLNIDFANHLIKNGYKVKSKSGFILEAIRSNYAESERAGKNRLKTVEKNIEESKRQQDIKVTEDDRRKKEEARIWWEQLSQEKQNKYYEEFKTGSLIQDKEKLIKARIFGAYIDKKI